MVGLPLSRIFFKNLAIFLESKAAQNDDEKKGTYEEIIKSFLVHIRVN